MDTNRSALVVMARQPTPGRVKTRLAAAIGAVAACDLYRAFLRDLAARFAAGRRRLVWAFHPPEADFAALIGADACCRPQRGADLGERMHNCFVDLCTASPAAVVMIGADVPHVRDEWLDEAEASLDSADVALGPSHDGGYYLVAMRRPHDAFAGVAMGTARVLEQTLQRTAVLGLRTHLLPETFDVDAVDDLRRLRALIERGEVHLPHTAAALAALRDL